jgi:hypothetical protein
VETGVILGLALALGLYLHRERKRARRQAEEQRALLAEVLQELVLLRNGLVESGLAERTGRLPPQAAAPARVKSPPPAASAHPPVDPLPAAAAPAPATPALPAPHAGVGDGPPSTKPSASRRRLVPFDEQIRRALVRMENRLVVPPHLEARWLERLRALAAELQIDESEGPTDEQAELMIRELYQADADDRDARDATRGRGVLDTLPSYGAVGLTIADADAMPLRGDAAPREDAEVERETGEDFTRVLTREPGAADAQIPGLAVVAKPVTGHSPNPAPRKLRDPLGGGTPNAPTSSPAPSAQARVRSQRPTLFDGLGGGAGPRSGSRAAELAEPEGTDPR